MSLTVPRAGVIAGQAARVRVEAPQIGAAIADFGARIAQKQDQMRQERDQLQLRRTQLDMARDLGEARLEMEQITDPVQLDAAWNERQTALRQKYLEPGADGQYLIGDEKLREQLGLDFTQMGDRQALAVGQRAIQLQQSQLEGEWIGMQADITAKAATADPDTLQAYIGFGDAAIEDRLARGSITPEAAAHEKADLREAIFSSRADAMIAENPEAFLAATQPDAEGNLGDWSALGERLPRYRLQAKGEIADRLEKAAKAAEVEAKARQTEIGKRLSEMTGLMSKGFAVSDESFLSNPEVMAHPDFAKARAAQSLRDEKPGIRRLTVKELDQQIAAEMAAPKTHEWQAERVEVLKQWRAEAATRANQDFVGLAREAEMPVPELPDFDPADPGAFAQGLAQRLSFDAYAVERGHTETQAVFGQDERAKIKAVLDPKADAAPKLALAQAMLTGGGAKLDRALSAAEADPVFSRATRVLRDTRDPALAEAILRGQQKEATGTVNLPSDKQMVSVFEQITGGVFDGDPRRKAEILATARALYADAAAGVNPDGKDSILFFLDDTAAQDLYATSVQRVLGAAPDRNGQLAIGGLQEVNDRKVYLPQGVSAAHVDRAFDVLVWQLQGRVAMEYMGERQWGWQAEGQPEPDRLRAFKAASTDGSAPALGPSATRLLAMAYPVRVGETDQYELRYMYNGREMAIPKADDPDGRAWRFKMGDLLRETLQ